jgi:hypothetical protein
LRTYEANELSAVARNWAAQIDVAGALAVQELRGMVTAIRDGAAPIPPKKPEPAPTSVSEPVPDAIGAESLIKYHVHTGRPTFKGAVARSPKVDPALAAAGFSVIDRSSEEREITVAVPRF